MKKILSILVVAALCVASVFSLVGCAGQDKINNGLSDIWDGVKEGAGEAIGDLVSPTSYRFHTTNHAQLALRSNASVSVPAGGGTPAHLEQTLSAVVHPSDTTYKNVEWSLYWMDETNQEPVTKYVTIASTEDRNTVVVKCWMPFEGKVIIKAAVEGFESVFATCEVSYVGIPSEMRANCGGVEIIDGDILDTFFTSEVLINYFGSNIIDADILLSNLEVSMEIVDSALSIGDGYDGLTYTFDELKTLDNEIYESIMEFIGYTINEDGSVLYYCTLQGGTLLSENGLVFEGGSFTMVLTVTDANTGVSMAHSIRFEEEPARVDLNNSEIVF